MKEIKILDIPIKDIEDNPFYAREFEEFDEADIVQLSKSFGKSGLLQPIVVRENIGDKPYQLIFGKRRKKAFQLIGKEYITAKIVEADDIEARIMALAENYHRKDLSTNEKEKSIYNLWLSGNENGTFHNSMHIMEEWTGVPHQILSEIISAQKEKEKDNSEEIQLSSYKDLQRTKGLKALPEVRKELLKGAVLKKTVKILDVAEAAKIIKNYIGQIHNNILLDIAKLFTQTKIKINNLEDFINLIVIIKIDEDQQKFIDKIKRDYGEQEKIDIYKLKMFVDVYIDSFEDIKEKLLNYNINIEEAKDLNLFKTRDQREKVLEDLRNFDKEIRYIEKEKIKYIKDKQKEDISDIEEAENKKYLIRVIEKEKEEDKIIKRIFKVRKDLLFFGWEEIESFDSDVKEKAIDMVWEVYNHYHEILVELGEIDNTKYSRRPIRDNDDEEN